MRHTPLLFLWSIIACSSILFGCGPKDSRYLGPETKLSKKQETRYAHPTLRPYVINNIRYYPVPSAVGYSEQGIASWYGKKFHGRSTANGEIYDMYGETAAHKTLPMNTMLLVKNLENGKETIVRVNDRGPFVKNRIIDLTYTGAQKIGMLQNGTARVKIIAMTDRKPEVTQQKAGHPQEKAASIFDQGTFYIQVGAFIKLENARRLAHIFADKGHDVIIQQYPAAGMNLYRVMVYGGTSLAKAKKFEKYLERHGYPHALVLAR